MIRDPCSELTRDNIEKLKMKKASGVMGQTPDAKSK